MQPNNRELPKHTLLKINTSPSPPNSEKERMRSCTGTSHLADMPSSKGSLFINNEVESLFNKVQSLREFYTKLNESSHSVVFLCLLKPNQQLQSTNLKQLKKLFPSPDFFIYQVPQENCLNFVPVPGLRLYHNNSLIYQGELRFDWEQQIVQAVQNISKDSKIILIQDFLDRIQPIMSVNLSQEHSILLKRAVKKHKDFISSACELFMEGGSDEEFIDSITVLVKYLLENWPTDEQGNNLSQNYYLNGSDKSILGKANRLGSTFTFNMTPLVKEAAAKNSTSNASSSMQAKSNFQSPITSKFGDNSHFGSSHVYKRFVSFSRPDELSILCGLESDKQPKRKVEMKKQIFEAIEDNLVRAIFNSMSKSVDNMPSELKETYMTLNKSNISTLQVTFKNLIFYRKMQKNSKKNAIIASKTILRNKWSPPSSNS